MSFLSTSGQSSQENTTGNKLSLLFFAEEKAHCEEILEKVS